MQMKNPSLQSFLSIEFPVRFDHNMVVSFCAQLLHHLNTTCRTYHFLIARGKYIRMDLSQTVACAIMPL